MKEEKHRIEEHTERKKSDMERRGVSVKEREETKRGISDKTTMKKKKSEEFNATEVRWKRMCVKRREKSDKREILT